MAKKSIRPDWVWVFAGFCAYAPNAGVRKLPYDSLGDFLPVTLIAVSPLMLSI